jgi:hypothetical protein
MGVILSIGNLNHRFICGDYVLYSPHSFGEKKANPSVGAGQPFCRYPETIWHSSSILRLLIQLTKAVLHEDKNG